MYGVVLWVHSWLRWLVLLAGGALLARACLAPKKGGWTPAADRLARAFLGVLDTQMLLGLLLWGFLSPLSRGGLANFSQAMASAPIRFFTVEHPLGMLLGVAVAHAGLARALRLDAARRPRVVVVTIAVWLLLTLASVPWPFLPYGRPLLRIG